MGIYRIYRVMADTDTQLIKGELLARISEKNEAARLHAAHSGRCFRQAP